MGSNGDPIIFVKQTAGNVRVTLCEKNGFQRLGLTQIAYNLLSQADKTWVKKLSLLDKWRE